MKLVMAQLELGLFWHYLLHRLPFVLHLHLPHFAVQEPIDVLKDKGGFARYCGHFRESPPLALTNNDRFDNEFGLLND